MYSMSYAGAIPPVSRLTDILSTQAWLKGTPKSGGEAQVTRNRDSHIRFKTNVSTRACDDVRDDHLNDWSCPGRIYTS